MGKQCGGWFEAREGLVVEAVVAEVCRKGRRVAPVSTVWQKLYACLYGAPSSNWVIRNIRGL